MLEKNPPQSGVDAFDYDLMNTYPAIGDVQRAALRRIPVPVKGFMESGTGDETCLARNRAAFDEILFEPRPIGPGIEPDLNASLFGHSYSAPFGISPLGMVNMIWPGMDDMLRRAGLRHDIPNCISMFSSTPVESFRDNEHTPGWFQLYPLRSRDIFDDLVDRVEKTGCDVLVVTVDGPVLGRREPMRRAGFAMPKPRIDSPRFRLACMARPRWFMRMRKHGIQLGAPLSPYAESSKFSDVAALITREMPCAIDVETIARLRERWPRKLVVKGICSASEAIALAALGVDGILVSNHGGRQLDAAPPSPIALKAIRQAVGKDVVLILDSGVRSGLDVARAIALGANFVFLGRPFLYGGIEFDDTGLDLIVHILRDELSNTMSLLGTATLNTLSDHLVA